MVWQVSIARKSPKPLFAASAIGDPFCRVTRTISSHVEAAIREVSFTRVSTICAPRARHRLATKISLEVQLAHRREEAVWAPVLSDFSYGMQYGTVETAESIIRFGLEVNDRSAT